MSIEFFSSQALRSEHEHVTTIGSAARAHATSATRPFHATPEVEGCVTTMIFTPFGEESNYRRPRNAATIACANSGAIAPIMVMRAPATTISIRPEARGSDIRRRTLVKRSFSNIVTGTNIACCVQACSVRRQVSRASPPGIQQTRFDALLSVIRRWHFGIIYQSGRYAVGRAYPGILFANICGSVA